MGKEWRDRGLASAGSEPPSFARILHEPHVAFCIASKGDGREVYASIHSFLNSK